MEKKYLILLITLAVILAGCAKDSDSATGYSVFDKIFKKSSSSTTTMAKSSSVQDPKIKDFNSIIKKDKSGKLLYGAVSPKEIVSTDVFGVHGGVSIPTGCNLLSIDKDTLKKFDSDVKGYSICSEYGYDMCVVGHVGLANTMIDCSYSVGLCPNNQNNICVYDSNDVLVDSQGYLVFNCCDTTYVSRDTLIKSYEKYVAELPIAPPK